MRQLVAAFTLKLKDIPKTTLLAERNKDHQSISSTMRKRKAKVGTVQENETNAHQGAQGEKNGERETDSRQCARDRLPWGRPAI